MKEFTNIGDINSYDIVHMKGDKDKYTITENSGTLTYESISLDRKYIITNIEEMGFKYSNGVSNLFKWSDEFSPFYHLLEGLQSYWPLDGNLTDIIGDRDLSSYGSGSFENVKFGAGYYIHDGGFLQVDTNDFHYDEFSISMWVEYINGYDTNNTTPIIVNYESDWELSVKNGTSSYEWAVWGNPANSWKWVDTNLQSYNNNLKHLVFQYNRNNNRIEIWVDGVLVHSYSFNRTPNNNTTTLTIGGRSETLGTATSRSNLKVSDIAVYNRNLVADDINLIIANANLNKRLIT